MATLNERDWAASGGVDGIDDDNELEEEFYSAREAVLVIIEVTPSMLEPDVDDDDLRKNKRALAGMSEPATSKLEQVLRCIYDMLSRKVISTPKDPVGVLLYGVTGTHDIKAGETGTKLSLGGARLLIPLEQPKVKSMKLLRHILRETQQDSEYLKKQFQASPPSPKTTSNAIGYANSLFRESVKTRMNKRILLVTDNDNPLKGADKTLPMEEVLRVTLTKRKATLSDVDESGIDIEPYFLPPSNGKDFDVETFWGPVITMAQDYTGTDEESDIPWPEAATTLNVGVQQLLESIRVNDAARRTAFSVPFIIRPGLTIGINGYNLIGTTRKKPATKIDLSSTNAAEVVKKTIYLNADDQTRLDPKKDVRKYFQLSEREVKPKPSQLDDQQGAGPSTYSHDKGKGRAQYIEEEEEEPKKEPVRIFFSDEDIRRVKTLGQSPNMRLLGFKPRKQFLKFYETIRHAYFIYPDEQTYSGSTRTFAALLEAMVELDVIGYAALLPRTSGHHRICVMLPQEEKRNEKGLMTQGSGIHLIQLPFADELRELGIDETASAFVTPTDDEPYPEQPAIDVAKQVVKKLTFKRYEPDDIPNPVLAHWNASLAAIAMDLPDPEPVDASLPKYDLIKDRAGEHLRQLKELIDLTERDLSKLKLATGSGAKRKAETKEALDPSKMDLSWLKPFLKEPTKFKVAQLKDRCKELQLTVSGNKSDLIERLNQAVEELNLVAVRKKQKEDAKAAAAAAAGEGGGHEEADDVVFAEPAPKKARTKDAEGDIEMAA